MRVATRQIDLRRVKWDGGCEMSETELPIVGGWDEGELPVELQQRTNAAPIVLQGIITM